MKLSIGIVGLPNVGKSTLFKALTNQEVNIANYPFATIDPNVGVVSVPDKRIDALAQLSNSKKKIYAVVEFYDIAGLVKGANKGEGLGNQFLSHIRETKVIVQVVRCFKSDDITHVEEKIDPERDIDIINTELILKDIDVVEKRLESVRKDAKTGNKEKIAQSAILEKVAEVLDGNILVNSLDKEFLSDSVLRDLNLLTAKPQLYLLNGSRDEVSPELLAKIEALGGDYLIADLSKDDSIDELIRSSYEMLGLISFFTTGEDETRAWTIVDGTKAPEAAGVIHTDFEKNFIRAEAINWQKLIEAGGWQNAKQKGWLRVEGKTYTIQDGDVIEVRHG